MMPTLLNDRYRVIRVLAKGGFGETFLVEDSFLPSKRLCVLKQLKLVADDPQVHLLAQNRFQREAAILEDLGEACEQIPALYAYFEENDQFYLVQEWIEGQTLSDKVRAEGLFSEAMIRQLLADILPVLCFIHDRGIIHRDIKPSNIILRQTNRQPVLIDFGAVKEPVSTLLNAHGYTMSSIVIGTPGYMPAEQAAGRPIFSSDLFSLGITAIYLLTGKNPQSLEIDPKTGELTWRDKVPHLSKGLANLIDRAIQYHPRDRFATAAEMLSALQALPEPEAIDSLPLEDNIDTIQLPTSSIQATALPSHVIGFSQPPAQSSPAQSSPSQPSPSRPNSVPSAGSPPSIPPSPAASDPIPGAPSPPSLPSHTPTLPVSPSRLVESASQPTLPPADLFPRSIDSPAPLPPTQVQPLKRRIPALPLLATLGGLIALTGGWMYYWQTQPDRQAASDLQTIKTLQAQGNHQECVSKAQDFAKTFPKLQTQVQPLLSDCAAAEDKATLQAAVEIASKPKADLQPAIDKAKSIPETSPVYAEAERYISKWQAILLQNYLRNDVPKQGAAVAETMQRLKPAVEQVTREQVTIRYDASDNPRYASDEGLRLFAAKFMELLQGDGKSIPRKYDDFSQLVVYSQSGTKQAVLTTDQWRAYLKQDTSLDRLLAQIRLQSR